MVNFPKGTESAIRLKKIYTAEDNVPITELASTRMVKCAAMLAEDSFIGWQMYLPAKRISHVSFFGGDSVTASDLEWITENCAKTCCASLDGNEKPNDMNALYLLSLDIRQNQNRSTVGFCREESGGTSATGCFWPTRYSYLFPEIVRVLREQGAVMRLVFSKASSSETAECRQSFVRTWNQDSASAESYFGKPVKLSILLRLPCEPSIRIRSVFDEAVPGLKFRYLGNMSDISCREIWDDPRLVGTVYPEGAARILVMEPFLFSSQSIIGIESCEKETPPIPAKHDNPRSRNALTIGKSIFTSGEMRKVKIDDTSLKMHWDLVGMSGTGKSSLLIQTVLSAVETNHSCTVIDPHGSLVNSVMGCIPQKYASRIKVIRFGEADKNPVPIRIHKTDDFEKEEIQINNICSMFQEVFDPGRKGYVGPRWIRIYSLLCRCSLVLGLGGTFQSILTLAQSKNNMSDALEALLRSRNDKYRDIYEGIQTELYRNRSSDFEDIISWFVSKFQTLLAIPQLRNTFGVCGAANAVDFSELIDSDKVLLIDLASPTVGQNAAKIAGTLIVNQLWDSILNRKCPDRNHILIVDEAHLFSGSGSRLNQILYEGRKFGVSLIMAHQNCSQLSPDIREAVGTTANFSSFRLSVTDAAEASYRFGNDSFRTKLCRLGNFKAVSTLSVNGMQSEPFTLQIKKPRFQKEHEAISRMIEAQSMNEFVEPFREIKPMTTSDILTAIGNFCKKDTKKDNNAEQAKPKPNSESGKANAKADAPAA